MKTLLPAFRKLVATSPTYTTLNDLRTKCPYNFSSSDVLYVMAATPQIIKAVPIIKNLNVLNLQLGEILPYLFLLPKTMLPPFFGTNQPSYAQITSFYQNHSHLSSSIETLLTSFISEFSNIIKPFLSLLITLLSKSQI